MFNKSEGFFNLKKEWILSLLAGSIIAATFASGPILSCLSLRAKPTLARLKDTDSRKLPLAVDYKIGTIDDFATPPWGDPQILEGRTYFERRSFVRKAIDRTFMFSRECRETIKTALFKRGIRSRNYFFNLQDEPVYKANSSGLWVMIHGLNGHPGQWAEYADQVVKDLPQADLLVPFVYKLGNCSVKEAADPIVEKIKNYILQHPQKPIALLGVSNGARIVSYIELALRDQPTPITVTTVAGAHLGSMMMDVAKRLRVFQANLREELSFASGTTVNQVRKSQEPLLGDVVREMTMIMTTEETLIQPFISELAVFGQGEKHAFVHGEGHNSVVQRSKDWVMFNTKKFMNKYKPGF